MIITKYMISNNILHYDINLLTYSIQHQLLVLILSIDINSLLRLTCKINVIYDAIWKQVHLVPYRFLIHCLSL